MVALIGDLIDADAAQPREPINLSLVSAQTLATIAPTVRQAMPIFSTRNCPRR
jgi:hypothetical protein